MTKFLHHIGDAGRDVTSPVAAVLHARTRTSAGRAHGGRKRDGDGR